MSFNLRCVCACVCVCVCARAFVCVCVCVYTCVFKDISYFTYDAYKKALQQKNNLVIIYVCICMPVECSE